MPTFAATPARFAGACAAVRRPQEIASFSYDEARTFRADASALRYYYPARLGADLSRGFERFEKLDDSADEHLDGLLRALMLHEQETGARVEADVVTWRGMMTKILCAPFDNYNSFEMNAALYQADGETDKWWSLALRFIEENHAYKLAQTQAQHSRPPDRGGPSQDLMTYWGYKFETLSLIPRPWGEVSRDFIEGREDHVVNNHSQYCCVVKTGVGTVKMVLGGEVDAVWDTKPENTDIPANWVELKTSEEPVDGRGALRFERKLLKFWAQSFMLGVPKIIVGFRSRDGFLRRIDELSTVDIPRQVKAAGRRTWDGNVCINFAAAFLEWLKSVITEPGVWRIRKTSLEIEVFRLEGEEGYGRILSPDFVQWREQCNPAATT